MLYPHIYLGIQKYPQTHIRVYVYICTHTGHTLTHKHIHTYIHTYTHRHIQVHIHAHTWTYTYTRTHTHAHTYTHMHAIAFPQKTLASKVQSAQLILARHGDDCPPPDTTHMKTNSHTHIYTYCSHTLIVVVVVDCRGVVVSFSHYLHRFCRGAQNTDRYHNHYQPTRYTLAHPCTYPCIAYTHTHTHTPHSLAQC